LGGTDLSQYWVAGVAYWVELAKASSTQHPTPAISNIGGQYQKL